MNNTKQKILQAALMIFNKEGISDATLRKIAQHMGISQGNLNYHFKKKEDLVEALYFELVNKLNYEFENLVMTSSLFENIYRSSMMTMTFLYEYKFILRDLYKIMKDYPAIASHYIQLQKERQKQTLSIFNNMIDNNLMRNEEFAGEYDRLHVRMNIFGDNWINAMELLNNKIDDPVKYYTELLFEMMYPYLTRKGKKEYLLLIRTE